MLLEDEGQGRGRARGVLRCSVLEVVRKGRAKAKGGVVVIHL